ncbi:helicase associated domain-containing protein [Dermacoccus abyssi]
MTPTTTSNGLTKTQTTLLRALDQWAATHGNLDIPQHATMTVGDELYPIGRRVHGIRRRYNDGLLSREMQAELIRRPGWAWSATKASDRNELPTRWAATRDELAAYAREHDGLSELRKDSVRLHSWLLRQRKALEAGALNSTQERSLRAIPGAVPNVPQRGPERTIRFAQDLSAWLDNHHRDISDIRTRDRFPWDGTDIALLKRVLYYRSRGPQGENSLTPEEVAALEQIPGWSW